MTLNEFGMWTDKVWKSGVKAEDMDDKDMSIVSLGMAGETGEALEYVKKYLRDGKEFFAGTDRGTEFAKELGDILFYWVRLARFAGYDPEDIIAINVAKLEKRHADRIAKAA